MIYGIDHRIPCKDHIGNSFPSIKAMCEHWNITPTAYSRRVNIYQWDVEKALTTPVKRNGGVRCVDHNGKKFKSISKMCKYHSIDRKLFMYRISHGWTLEDALTKSSGS